MLMTRLLALGLLLMTASPVLACLRCPQYPPWTPPPAGVPAPASMNAADWTFWAEGPTATLDYWVHPYNADANGYLRILFPPWGASLNALLTVPFYRTTGARFLNALVSTITVSGTPVMIPDDCAGPARARLFMYSAANRGTEWERLYAIESAVTLAPSSATWPPYPLMTADLADPSVWVSAAGTSAGLNPAALEAAKASAQLGVVFGGACSAGHGVGSAPFDARAEFVIQWLWAE